MSKGFWKATGIRALRTLIQSIAGSLTAGVLTNGEISTMIITALTTTAASVLMSISHGLPEVGEEENVP